MKAVILSLTSCPAAALGPYGNEWTATPNADRLAAEGVVFDRHIADVPDAAAAWRHAQAAARGFRASGVPCRLVRNVRPANDPPAELLGGWDEVVEARPDPADPSPADALFRVLPPLFDRLAAEASGVVWIVSDRFEPPWDVPRDVFEVYMEDLADADSEPDEEEAAGSRVVDLPPGVEVDWSAPDAPDDDGVYAEEDEDDEPADEPVEYPDPWADPATGWFDRDDLDSWELLHRSFAAAVTAWDADLGRLVEAMRSRGLLDAATFALTAGRGYPLGEHGLIGSHRPWLHEELVHLPMIVRRPEGHGAGVRSATLTQPDDLGAILIAAKVAPRDLALSHSRVGDAEERSVRTVDWALLLPVSAYADDDERPTRLYRKPEDHWEVNDVRAANLAVADELEEKLTSALTAAAARASRPSR